MEKNLKIEFTETRLLYKKSSALALCMTAGRGNNYLPQTPSNYTRDIPLPPINSNINILSYADDITLTSQHTDPYTTANNLQPYINTLERWLAENRLKVAPTKSTVTLLTNDTHQHNISPLITLNNTPIPYTNETKMIGVTYNTSLSFAPHIANIKQKIKPRLNTIRSLTGTSFGDHKETTSLVYKQYIRPVAGYASPA